jgi:ethanolamine ammonia-lyase large subunit
VTFSHTIRGRTYRFDSLKAVLAKASPLRSGDTLAGIAADSDLERTAAKFALADVPLTTFLIDAVVPYEYDDVTRLIFDSHDKAAFAPISHLTVGQLREWILSEECHADALASIAAGLTPEMVAAVSKLMRNQELILAVRKCRVITRFRNTLGLPGRMSVRLQPNHPTDDPQGVLASTIDGLLYGCGDAVIGVKPATDSTAKAIDLLRVLDNFRMRFDAPLQTCVLTHVLNTLNAIETSAPVDLVFQSVAGTQKANERFGVTLGMLHEVHEAAQSLNRGTVGRNCMYFETGQGSALSAGAHLGIDQQTCEARAYAVARRYAPLLVNTVVGFIGPEYLFGRQQIIRACLEDHFCGKLLGLPMGCEVCYANHAEADQDDMDTLLTLLGVAGVNFVMGAPGADVAMLNYQSASFHDALYVRELLGLRRAPEFELWLQQMGIVDQGGRLMPSDAAARALFSRAPVAIERS